MGNRKTREEIIALWQALDNKECLDFYSLPHEMKSQQSVFKFFCEKHGGNLAIILSDDLICDNKELVIIAGEYGFSCYFELLSERLLNDPDVAIALANCNRYEYTKINKEIRNNVEIMMKAIHVNPTIFISLPVKVRTDKRILNEVASREPWLLQYLSGIRKDLKEQIFNNKELALIVAERDPGSLIYFSDRIRSDKDILTVAFCLNDCLEMKRRLKKYTWGFSYLDIKYWAEDELLVKRAVKLDGTVYASLPERWKFDRGIALFAVKNRPYMIKECPDVSKFVNLVVSKS